MSETQLPTTGPYSLKDYECTRCGHVHKIGTNHWGPCYPSCPNCSWKHPMNPLVEHKCLEPVPPGYAVPEPWKQIKLGDVCEIKQWDS